MLWSQWRGKENMLIDAWWYIFMQVCFSKIKTNENCVLEQRKTERCPMEGPPSKHDDAIQPPL